MPKDVEPDSSADIPQPAEFEAWDPERLHPLLQDKTVVFSPGGSTRWFFVEYADAATGYASSDRFLDYAERSLRHTLDITNLMFADGIRTVFVVGVMPRQSKRGPTYASNLAAALKLIASQTAETLYEKNEVGVLFRGAWPLLFEELGIASLMEQCEDLEHRTTPKRDRWLVWLTRDDAIPGSLTPLLAESLKASNALPDRAELCRAYYGRAVEHVDIFIGHNKPNVNDQIPPLTTVGDLYFTLRPSYYLDRPMWRRILYDHLFARRGQYRDLSALGPDALEDLRVYYEANQSSALGLGAHHAPTQTWRPSLSGT